MFVMCLNYYQIMWIYLLNDCLMFVIHLNLKHIKGIYIFVVLFNHVVYPLTFKDDNNVVLFYNFASPLIFKDDKNIELFSTNILLKKD